MSDLANTIGALTELRKDPRPRGYADADLHRDFRAVFLGSALPEQQRRVLWILLDWAYFWEPALAPSDPHLTMMQEGRREMGLKIKNTLTKEPRREPVRVEGGKES